MAADNHAHTGNSYVSTVMVMMVMMVAIIGLVMMVVMVMMVAILRVVRIVGVTVDQLEFARGLGRRILSAQLIVGPHQRDGIRDRR
jgi:uncharacterized membrane protein